MTQDASWPNRSFTIEKATTDADFLGVEGLQTQVWSRSTTVPAPLLRVLNKIGGLVLVARSSTGEVIGLSTALPGRNPRADWLWSHMAGVNPSWRGTGVGTALKREQYRLGRDMGYRVITWTFDPLEALNAHFNFERVGAFSRTYLEDAYGAMDDPLNRGLPSDRLVAEWWTTDRLPDVSDAPPTMALLRAVRSGEGIMVPVLDPSVTLGPRHPSYLAAPVPVPADLASPPVTIEIPLDFRSVRESDSVNAQKWRAATARAFCHAFQGGCVARTFTRDVPAGVGRYLLYRAGGYEG